MGKLENYFIIALTSTSESDSQLRRIERIYINNCMRHSVRSSNPTRKVLAKSLAKTLDKLPVGGVTDRTLRT